MAGSPEEKDYIQAANELSQAFKDIERGEQAAAALESNLSSLENKIDDLLKSAGQDGKIVGLTSENEDDRKVEEVRSRPANNGKNETSP